jgi:hypothetical protein
MKEIMRNGPFSENSFQAELCNVVAKIFSDCGIELSSVISTSAACFEWILRGGGHRALARVGGPGERWIFDSM